MTALIALIAHLKLMGRHRRKTVVFGLTWGYCLHWSHRWTLPCWRWAVYDGYCGKHNTSCYAICEYRRGET